MINIGYPTSTYFENEMVVADYAAVSERMSRGKQNCRHVFDVFTSDTGDTLVLVAQSSTSLLFSFTPSQAMSRTHPLRTEHFSSLEQMPPNRILSEVWVILSYNFQPIYSWSHFQQLSGGFPTLSDDSDMHIDALLGPFCACGRARLAI